jgi:EAL domain-containing protein (putative c-di-GMP-specific phosphodiesterase class I)
VIARRQESRERTDSASGFDVSALAALNERRIELALQPVVRAQSREVSFHEALLRVSFGKDGAFFATAELIPMLERRGLVRLFDHRVLELAVGLLASEPSPRLPPSPTEPLPSPLVKWLVSSCTT